MMAAAVLISRGRRHSGAGVDLARRYCGGGGVDLRHQHRGGAVSLRSRFCAETPRGGSAAKAQTAPPGTTPGRRAQGRRRRPRPPGARGWRSQGHPHSPRLRCRRPRFLVKICVRIACLMFIPSLEGDGTTCRLPCPIRGTLDLGMAGGRERHEDFAQLRDRCHRHLPQIVPLLVIGTPSDDLLCCGRHVADAAREDGYRDVRRRRIRSLCFGAVRLSGAGGAMLAGIGCPGRSTG